MINSLSLFEQIQLAEAAYASFNGNIGNGKLISDALQGVKKEGETGNAFSKTQAQEFLKHWRVADQYATGGTADDSSFDWFGSGFSATLFERIDRPGEYTFAVRGSIGINDFNADLDLIFNSGLAAVQVVDMYNYWQSLSAPKGQTYRAAKLNVSERETAARLALANNLPAQKAYELALFAQGAILAEGKVYYLEFGASDTLLEDEALRFGRGLIKETPKRLNVAGHSLGGHLACNEPEFKQAA